MLKQEIEKYLGQIADDPNNPGGPGKKEPTPAPAGSVERKQFNSNDEANSYLGDMINYSLAHGGNPLTTKQGRIMFQTARGLYGDKVAHELLDQTIIHNQREDMKGKSSEDKINSFYEIVHGSPELEKMKGKISHIGYGPVAQYHSSPDVETQEEQSGVKSVVKN